MMRVSDHKREETGRTLCRVFSSLYGKYPASLRAGLTAVGLHDGLAGGGVESGDGEWEGPMVVANPIQFLGVGDNRSKIPIDRDKFYVLPLMFLILSIQMRFGRVCDAGNMIVLSLLVIVVRNHHALCVALAVGPVVARRRQADPPRREAA